AIGLLVVNWILLGVLILRGRSSAETMREALVDLVGDHDGPRIPKWKVWLPLVARYPDVKRTRNVEYSRAGGRRLRLDVYEPAAEAAPGERRRAIVQIHGGAWVLGD